MLNLPFFLFHTNYTLAFDLSTSITFGVVVVHCRRLLLGFLAVLWL